MNVVGLHASAENIGFTIGNMATVQMEPLEKFESYERLRVSFSYQMLARAIAHEFGHVLLGPGHSSRASCEPAGAKTSGRSQPSTIWSLPLTRKRRCAWRSRRAWPQSPSYSKQTPRSLGLALRDENASGWLARSAPLDGAGWLADPCVWGSVIMGLRPAKAHETDILDLHFRSCDFPRGQGSAVAIEAASRASPARLQTVKGNGLCQPANRGISLPGVNGRLSAKQLSSSSARRHVIC